jgi:hypothetical protein
LTLIKSGDLRYDRLVGRRICYTCVARVFRSQEPDTFEIRWLLIAEITAFVITAASLAITGLLRLDLTIPAGLLLFSLGFFVSERYLRTELRKRRLSKPRKPSEDLVSVEKLLDS